MGNIQFKDNKILFTSDTVAMDPACCDRCCPNDCDPDSPDFASSYTLSVDLWAAAEGTDCQDSTPCDGEAVGEFTATIPPLPPMEQQLDGLGNKLCIWYVDGEATLTYPNAYTTSYHATFWRCFVRYGSIPGLTCGGNACWILYAGPDNVSWDCGLQPPPCIVWYGYKRGGKTPVGRYVQCPSVTNHRPDIPWVDVL
jgi:hypothetical protein